MSVNFPTPGIFTSGDYKKDLHTLLGKLIRTKDVDSLEPEFLGERPAQRAKLTKCLTTLDLTSLGVGSCVGTGMYLVSGMVAKNYAGPGVVFSFVIAALASILSGVCYAEFGVRVPHTSGSAYMYSYVTVGEFIAFVIGWNMILEYLIGTAACACALSACFDSLTRGKINDTLHEKIGPFFGHTPDLIAFAITLIMMLILALGVKKSLIFNNVLNIINFSVWVFIMTAGLFYVKFDNWSDFLPNGWSGVFTGAATCFYAFIGFDIIATTGEEATNPKKSIPLAIIYSLIIILAAYVTSSMMLTLIVPYYQVSSNSALVSMFGQVGAVKCQMVVAVGALAGLTVSMFGSMFPMPRIIYAMAQDGLVFRFLSRIFEFTGTPVLATFISGSCAALAAMLLNLEILVEMMSIGTLLAYTLVSTCVLILRYQPHSTNLMELLPENLRTPMKESAPKPALSNGKVNAIYENPLNPENIKKVFLFAKSTVAPKEPPIELQQTTPAVYNQRVFVRRVTRSSPDSDDTFGGEESEDCSSIRDDQFLVSDRTENKFYGTVAAGSTPTPKPASTSDLASIGRRIKAATYSYPIIFPWMDCGPATEESGKFVLKLVLALYPVVLFANVVVVFLPMSGLAKYSVYAAFIAIIGITLVISKKPQNKKGILFMTPGVPFVPVIAITVNIYLILNLSILTLVRFTIWMILGFVVYLYYGLKNSTLETGEAGDGMPKTTTYTPVVTITSAKSSPQTKLTENVKSVEQIPPVRPATLETPKTTVQNDLFVSPSAFPKWDD